MSNQPLKDGDENDKQSSIPNPRPIRQELLRKMYYPDTLYPDTYTFYASPRSRAVDTNEPTTTTTTTTTNLTTNPRPPSVEIEMTERQSKYSVSILFLRKENVIFDRLQCHFTVRARKKKDIIFSPSIESESFIYFEMIDVLSSARFLSSSSSPLRTWYAFEE